MRMIKSLPVDAGNISMIHESVVKQYGLEKGAEDNYLIVENKTGMLSILVKGTWNGVLSEMLDCDTGKYYIGDACYFIKDDNWMKFLEDTKYMDDMPDNSICLSTGGDGEFEVVVNPTLREIREAQEDYSEEDNCEEDNYDEDEE